MGHLITPNSAVIRQSFALRDRKEAVVPVVDSRKWSGAIFSGTWRAGSGPVRDVTNPATGEVVGQVGTAAVDDVDGAAGLAATAQPAWAQTGYPVRADVFRRAAAALAAERDAVVGWLIREGGGTAGKGLFEVSLAIDELLTSAALVTQPIGELLPAEDAQRQSIARRVPFGVVGVISPWNFPLILALRSVAPALAVGNAVVLKPDPKTAVCGGALIASLFEEAGLPEGLLHVLPGGVDVGEALVVSAGTDMISFTGSTRAGHRVGELAGARLKRVALELGGNNAFIVLDDADVDVAVNNGGWGAFVHQGQICMAVGRHLVHESLATEYLDKITKLATAQVMGDPGEPSVTLGPLISIAQAERVESIVEASVAAGARPVLGGQRAGCFYPATVLDDVRPGMAAFDEEIFGPVIAVTTFSTDEDAARLANATGYGLVAAVQTRSVARGLRLANQLRTGMVHVNDQTVDDRAHIPMGGRGRSGNGSRFGGHWSIDEFTQWQWLTTREIPLSYPR
jgi:benzaldehyde dehydrogenase (NAD)